MQEPYDIEIGDRLQRKIKKLENKDSQYYNVVINENQPTTITDIVQRLSLSESTISRQIGRLVDLKTLDLAQKGKTKEVRITLTGKLLL